jgi:uncharacterized phosphosugar-binding protein
MTPVEANLIDVFAEHVVTTLETVQRTQMEQMQRAAQLITTAFVNGGILRTFGAGHSAVVASDMVYRAGGFVPVDMLAEQGLSGLTEHMKSEFLERLEGYAKIVLDYHDITPPDVLLVVSNSGRNAAPIEMAIEATKRGVPVIAITSLAHSKGTDSRHSSGRRLFDVADVVIDNCGVLGDAAITLEGVSRPVGPTSSIAGLFIVHAIMAQVAANMQREGIAPPLFRSGNLDGSWEMNSQLTREYRSRIHAW